MTRRSRACGERFSMTYYAKTNTAFPGVGFISVGEVLTEAQAAALGQETIQALLSRGVLGAQETGKTAQAADEAATAADRPAEAEKPTARKAGNARKRAAESPVADPPAPPSPGDAPDEEEDAELPSLSADDLLGGAEAPKAKRGGRKAR